MWRVGAALLCLLGSGAAYADDHRDAPLVITRPGADLSGLYAWTSGQAREIKLNLVLGVEAPGFDTGIQYVFHVASGPAYGASTAEVEILCQFEGDRQVACWIGDELYLAGHASGNTGLGSPDGRLRIFTGLRNDPFYFNLRGFEVMLALLGPALENTPVDAAGCPSVAPATANQLLTQLMQDEHQGLPLDFYARGPVPEHPGHITALVLQLDRALVAKGGDVLAIWASTHLR